MKRIRISVDASCYMDKIEEIKYILKNKVQPLLRFHFNILDVYIDDVFVVIDIDVENSTMDYVDIVNYCHDLCQTILFEKGYDCIIACYTA